MIDTICLIIIAVILVFIFVDNVIFDLKIKHEHKKLDKCIEEKGDIVEGILEYDKQKDI